MPEDLSYRHTEALLVRLGAELCGRLILVGGQAVNFWAEHYAKRAPDQLGECGPFSSKDIDVAASRKDVEDFAARIKGKGRVAGFDDHTPNAGTVSYLDDDGVERTLDVMANLVGVVPEELEATAVRIEYTPKALIFRVMHPVLMLESRVYNVFNLEKYRTVHGLQQLRAAVLCARFYLEDKAQIDPKGVLKWNEQIFRLRTRRPGKCMASDYQIDVFEALAVASTLPAQFHTMRYPRMLAAVKELRERGS